MKFITMQEKDKKARLLRINIVGHKLTGPPGPRPVRVASSAGFESS